MNNPEIRYLKNDDINKIWWDECLENSPYAVVYAQSWYLDRVAPRWAGLVVEGDRCYQAVFPLPCKTKWGIGYVYPPYFTQQLGLFTKEGMFNDQFQHAFISEVKSRFRWIYHKLHTASYTTDLSLLGHASWEQGITHHLDLQETYHHIKSNYSTNHKRNISKADKVGFIFDTERAGVEGVVRLYIADKGSITADIKEEHYQVLISLFEEGYIREQAILATATTAEGKLAAGIVFMRYKTKLIYLFAASSAEGKKTGSMAWLIDKCIQKWAGNRLILDFEGSSIEGIARFYRGFGAEPVSFPILKINNLPAILKLFKK